MRTALRPAPLLRRAPLRLILLLLLLAAACETATVVAPDTTAPTVALAAPTDGATVDTSVVELRGTLADDEAVVRATYQVNGGAEREIPVAPGATVALVAPVELPAGTSTLLVHAYDAAGNRGSSQPVRATRRELFTIVAPEDGSTVHSSSIPLRSTTPRPFDIERITYQVNGGEETHYPRYVHHGAYYYLAQVALRDGDNTLAVHAYLVAGGRVTREVRVRYVELARVRLSAPVVDSWNPGVVRAGVDTLTVAGTAAHTKGVVRVTYRVKDGPEVEVPITPGDSVPFRAVLRLEEHGANPVTVSAYDPTGNRGTVAIPVAHPAPDAAAGSFASVSAGQDHTCGLTTAGAAYCWGSDREGQLGDGGEQYGVPDKPDPARVAGGLAFRGVVANRGGGVGAGGSESFACGIAEDGRLFCWGSNALGELGLGSDPRWSVREPTEVSGGRRWADVALGARHTCALTVEGEAWCWGANQGGQLGNGATTPPMGAGSSNPAPAAVRGGLRFRSVAAGWAHTCALTGDGSAYCWGGNAHGQLGTGTAAGSLEPVAVSGGLRFRAITAGDNFTCGLTADGTAYCWGANDARQLGTGSAISQVERPTPVAGGLAFDAISGGQKHACGVSGGRVYCWGQPQFSATHGAVPTPVGGPATFRTVSAGYRHSCGVTANGAAYCWGTGENGRLGTGTTLSSAVPIRVTDPR